MGEHQGCALSKPAEKSLLALGMCLVAADWSEYSAQPSLLGALPPAAAVRMSTRSCLVTYLRGAGHVSLGRTGRHMPKAC